MKNIQNETFEMRRLISELASKAVAAPVVKKRLTDIQDVEIIESEKLSRLFYQFSLINSMYRSIKIILDGI